MPIRTCDVVPISEAGAQLTQLADEVVAGHEKLLTKNGVGYVALVDARRLDYYRELEAEFGFMLLASAAMEALATVGKGNVLTTEQTDELLRGGEEPAGNR